MMPTLFVSSLMVAFALTRSALAADDTRTVRSVDGQIELTIPASMSDRPTADVLVLSVFDFHTHRAVTCTVRNSVLNDRVKTLADFAQKTWQNSDLSGPRLGAPQAVKLPNGLYVMQADRRIPDPREPKYELVTMVAVPSGFEAISIVFPETDGKVDRSELEKIVNTLHLPKGGGEQSSVPTTGPATAPANKVWVSKNGLVRLTVPDNWVEGKTEMNPQGIVVKDDARRIFVSVSMSPRPAAALGPATETTRQEMVKSNFAAKATRPQELRFGQRRAMRFEVTANVQGEDMLTIATIVELPRVVALVQVVGPLETMRADRSFVESIAGTLVEANAPPAAAPAPQQQATPAGSPSAR
jgi:hypothetical protein